MDHKEHILSLQTHYSSHIWYFSNALDFLPNDVVLIVHMYCYGQERNRGLLEYYRLIHLYFAAWRWLKNMARLDITVIKELWCRLMDKSNYFDCYRSVKVRCGREIFKIVNFSRAIGKLKKV